MVMANFISELEGKIVQWQSSIEQSQRDYREAQSSLLSINNQIMSEMNNPENSSSTILSSLSQQRSFEERRMTKATLEITKMSAEIASAQSQIDEKIAKIDKASKGIISLGSVNKYGKAGIGSSSVKSEMQQMKTALLQLSQLKTKLSTMGATCVLPEGDEDKPKVKSIWQETNPYKKPY